MNDSREFYQVTSDWWNLKTSDHLEHGYEEEADYRRALHRLIDRWKNRIGEKIDERYDFIRLRFHDTPGGLPDEEWFPILLLHSVPIPDYLARQESSSSDEIEKELNRAFGFD